MMKKLFSRGSKKDVSPGTPRGEGSEPSSPAPPPDGSPAVAPVAPAETSPGWKASFKTNKESLAGIGVVFQIAPDGGFYIKSMSPDGAAAESGILREGDCLIAIDGELVFGRDADYITKKIIGPKGSSLAVKFRRNVILPDGRSEFRHLAPVITRGKPAEIPKPAGVGIIFKVGSDMGMYVKALSPGGPAAESKQIAIHDRLVSVDGKSISGKTVTEITPFLVGAFGTRVDIGLKRRDAEGAENIFQVSLIRGKKATFKDDEHFLLPETTKAVSIMVPPSAKPGDILEACDEEGNRSKVGVPHGAVPGTLLRVPIFEKKFENASSDPKYLAQLLKEVEEVPGRKDLFSWKGRYLRQLLPNGDGTCSIEDARTGEVIWHGFTEFFNAEAPSTPAPAAETGPLVAGTVSRPSASDKAAEAAAEAAKAEAKEQRERLQEQEEAAAAAALAAKSRARQEQEQQAAEERAAAEEEEAGRESAALLGQLQLEDAAPAHPPPLPSVQPTDLGRAESAGGAAGGEAEPAFASVTNTRVGIAGGMKVLGNARILTATTDELNEMRNGVAQADTGPRTQIVIEHLAKVSDNVEKFEKLVAL